MAGEALHQGELSVSVPGILSSLPESSREGQEKEGAEGGEGERRREEGAEERGGGRRRTRGEEGGGGRRRGKREKEEGWGKREEERRGGGRRGKAAGRRRREALSQRAGVTLGQCPPVPGSGFKIAVVSFVQHEKEPQQSAA